MFFAIPKFLSTSIFDFSVITNPNRVIFDSTDRSLSLLSKNTIFPNFSPQFIVQFDQILKDISKISKFPVDSTRIYHYTKGEPVFIVQMNKVIKVKLHKKKKDLRDTNQFKQSMRKQKEQRRMWHVSFQEKNLHHPFDGI